MEEKDIKVKFVNGHFVPLDRVDFTEGAVIEIEILSRKEDVQDEALTKEFDNWEKLSDESFENFEKRVR